MGYAARWRHRGCRVVGVVDEDEAAGGGWATRSMSGSSRAAAFPDAGLRRRARPGSGDRAVAGGEQIQMGEIRLAWAPEDQAPYHAPELPPERSSWLRARWATTACSGLWVSIMAAIASAHSIAVVHSGRERTRIRFVVAGQVERDDRYPGLHGWFDEHRQMRALAAPTVHDIPVAPRPTHSRRPDACVPEGLYRSSPGNTRSILRLDSRTGGVHHNSTARTRSRAGASRSEQAQKRQRIDAATTGGSTPEPSVSSGATSGLASASADNWSKCPSVITWRDRSGAALLPTSAWLAADRLRRRFFWPNT